MNHLIGTPETTADAWLVVRAIDRQGSQDELVEHYGPKLVAATIDIAYDWVDSAIDRRPLEYYGSHVGTAALASELTIPDAETTGKLPPAALDETQSLTLAAPADLAKTVRQDFPNPNSRFLGRKPQPFDKAESRVVVAALRRLARVSEDQPDVQLEVAQYLARNAPTAIEQMAARAAIRKFAEVPNLVQYYTDARTTRSRNSPHWFAATADRPLDQRRVA